MLRDSETETYACVQLLETSNYTYWQPDTYYVRVHNSIVLCIFPTKETYACVQLLITVLSVREELASQRV